MRTLVLLFLIIVGIDATKKIYENDNDYAMIIDVGSSGNKVSIYAKKSCYPGQLHGGVASCSTVTVSPKLVSVMEGNLDTPFFTTIHSILREFNMDPSIKSLGAQPMPDGRAEPAKWSIFAAATAGNRIVNSVSDSSAWKKYWNFGIKYANFQLGHTLSGVEEASLEFIAVAAETDAPRNFFSSGGASAQMGFLLDSSAKVAAWGNLISAVAADADTWNSGFETIACNNQDKPKHFIGVYKFVDERNFAPTSLSSCGSGNCVGLISFLAGASPDTLDTVNNIDYSCHRNNKMGGQKEVAHRFAADMARDNAVWSNPPNTKTDFMTLKTRSISGSNAANYNTVQKFYAKLYASLSTDKLVVALQNYFLGGSGVGTISDWYCAGAACFFKDANTPDSDRVFGQIFGAAYMNLFAITSFTKPGSINGDWPYALAISENYPYKCDNIFVKRADRPHTVTGVAIEKCEVVVDSTKSDGFQLLENEIDSLL